MTIKDAIYQLEDLIKDRESFCQRDDFDDIFLQDIEACKMGIKALEKQIPKKPLMNNRYLHNRCASCDGYVSIYETYCSDCGQAIDWDNVDTLYECPNCHKKRDGKYNYCPDCGAKMEV